MNFITWFVYFYIRLRLWLKDRPKSRLNVLTSNAEVTIPEANGMLPRLEEWKLALPNPNRNENITLVGSNTWQSGLYLQMKWRPNEPLKLSTLFTQFTLELGPATNNSVYDYEEIWTQSYDSAELRKYSGRNIQLEVLVPYRQYRLFFSGFMRNRSTNELVYIRFRSLISNAGKIFDFKETFDTKFMANQLAGKRHPFGYRRALDELILQDRHEHPAQFRSVYTIERDNESLPVKEEKLFCWGFHARHFIDIESSKRLRCKRILGYFANGISFHAGVIESTDCKQFGGTSKEHQLQFGYSCPSYQVTYPVQRLSGINWDHVSRDTRQFSKIAVQSDNKNIIVESLNRENGGIVESSFIDLIADGYKGRGFILINDCVESSDTSQLIEKSVNEYLSKTRNSPQAHSPLLIDLAYLDILSKTHNAKPMVVALTQKEHSLFSSLCGAKAASLAQLINYPQNDNIQFEVPRGLVVTRYAYDSILELNPELAREEKRLASVVCQGDQERIRCESERFQRFFLPKQSQREEHEQQNGEDFMLKKLKIPQQLKDELEELVLKTFEMSSLEQEGKSFAVRSSSWGEDEANMSAAGQLTTLLNVRLGQGNQGLYDALLACFGSKYSVTNLEYKRQHGLPIDMPMAIVIQEMIECDRAGVMFTCNPTNGDEREILITANYGLGESVVSAAADPDTIIVQVTLDSMQPNDLSKRQVGAIRQITIGQKKVVIKSNDDNSATTTITDGQDSSKCCMTDEEIMKLAKCGLKVAHYFRNCRDIEWGFKNGHLYLFQSRPVTGLDVMNDFELLHEGSRGLAAEKEWLTRANIGEVLPFAITPLTYSYVLQSWQIFGGHVFRSMDMGQSFPQQTPEFSLFNCFYFVVLRVSKIFDFGSGENRPLQARALEIGFFGHEVDDPKLAQEASKIDRKIPALITIFKFILSGLPYKFFPELMCQKAFKRVRNLRRDILKHKFVRTSSMSDLYKQMHIVVMEGCESWLAHIMLIIISPTYNQTLTTILSKHIKDPARIFAVYSKLLSSCKDVFSAGVPRQIEQMAKIIGANGDEENLKRFIAMNDTETLRYITSEPNSDLTKAFNKFMDLFGHRSYNEFELSSKPWRDEPMFVINMIKKACQDQLNKLQQAHDGKAKYAADCRESDKRKGSVMLKEMGVELSFFDRLYVDYYILPKCHQFLKCRELTKDLLIFNTDCLRDAVRMLAKELRQNCRIPDDDLLNYMTCEEVARLVEQHQPGLVDQAQRRRRFYKKLANWTFDEIISGHEFLPRHLMMDSAEARNEKERMKSLKKIPGTPACSGTIRGPVCIVNEYDQLSQVKPGDILVTYSTDIAFSPIFPIIGGIITEIGGLISHGAVIAREYGLPSLIGVNNATTIFKQGEMIELDATNGCVVRIEQQQ